MKCVFLVPWASNTWHFNGIRSASQAACSQANSETWQVTISFVSRLDFVYFRLLNNLLSTAPGYIDSCVDRPCTEGEAHCHTDNTSLVVLVGENIPTVWTSWTVHFEAEVNNTSAHRQFSLCLDIDTLIVSEAKNMAKRTNHHLLFIPFLVNN